MFEEACQANITYNLYDQLDAQLDALAKIEEAGVTIKRFPDEVLAALRKESMAVLEEESAKDPLFKEAFESLRDYTARMDRWNMLQQLPR